MARTRTMTKDALGDKEMGPLAPGNIVRVTYEEPAPGADGDTAQPDGSDASGTGRLRKQAIGIVMSHDPAPGQPATGAEPALTILTTDAERVTIPLSRITRATSTRSVPIAARKALASIYEWETIREPQWKRSIRQDVENMRRARAEAGADDVARTLATAMGAFSKEGFADAIRERLAGRLPAFDADGWRVRLDAGGWLHAVREVCVAEHYEGDMAYRGDDGTASIVTEATKTAEGRRLVDENHRELPLSDRLLDEGFLLGGDGQLIYMETYDLGLCPHWDSRMFTEELADEEVDYIIRYRGKG